jgi:hypothetical protein
VSERSAGPIGIALGVVLLGGVAAFGIALPKAVDDDPEPSHTAAAVDLPDELPHGLVAQDQVEGQVGDQYAKAQKSMVDGLQDIYGDPAAVRGYANADGTVQATVTVLDQAPGLFDPQGPPVAPEVLGLERSIYELRRVGDAVCNLSWQQVVPEGQPVKDADSPDALQCQQGDGDRTIELFVSGLTVDQASDVLDELGHDQ